jgi:hypothetical protein
MAKDIPATLYRQPGIPFVWSGSEEKLELTDEQVAAALTQVRPAGS